MMPADRTHPLAALLTAASPATLLTMGDEAAALAARLCPPACRRSQAATGETPLGRHEATLLSSDHDAALTAAGWTELLGHLRIRVSPRVWVLAADAHPLSAADYRALGFTCLPPWQRWRCYAYDLHHYKTTPDWLNARYWAHPERWEP